MSKIRQKEALDYHSQGRPGKVEVIPSKPTASQRDLALAYSPGVAEPCLAIAERPEDVYKYTGKGNLVAVISNGTAVLGLGNIGPEASKPVMEGKGVLFKIFADLDVFDIEVDALDVDKFVDTVKAIAPTFGGINLEDIKAPEAFEIEERLRAELDIPVMHDDQHGTAIISAAALINALELAEKDISEVKIVVSGAGAAALSCLNLFSKLGAKKENIVVFDSKGAITVKRSDLNSRKALWATEQKVANLASALDGADVFLGLSTSGVMTEAMVESMANDPIVFALANPEPEIPYAVAMKTRDDIIMATGRSDHPNQVNNVLGFPYIFRGAMDVRATAINDEMKMAAVRALSDLAKESVPDEVNEAYDMKGIAFGRDLIIPKPLDPRLITRISVAVAKAAIESGVARITIEDWEAYEQQLDARLGRDNKLQRNIAERARKRPQRVVFADAEHYKILKAAETAVDEGIAKPILLGDPERIQELAEEHHLDLTDCEILDPRTPAYRADRKAFAEVLFEKRQRKGLTLFEAERAMRDRNYYGAMMVNNGEADALISGIARKYPDVIRPALHVIGMEEEARLVAGMYIFETKQGPMFFADTTVNVDPTARELADIALITAKAVRRMKITPRIAMLTYGNFGSATGEDPKKVAEAVRILHEEAPDLVVDGELQANFALNHQLRSEVFPFSDLQRRKTNVLIFPNLSAGNIAYKLMQEVGELDSTGPVLIGMRKSFHVLQMGSSVREIVNMVRIAAVDAQSK